MINKIKETLSGMKLSPYITALVLCYALFVGLIAVLGVYKWLGHLPKAGTLQEIVNLLQVMVATNTVNCIYAVAKGFVDKDNDGIPDVFENH